MVNQIVVRFVNNSTRVTDNATLQMIRQIDAANAYSWRAPKSGMTYQQYREWVKAQGLSPKKVGSHAYKGGYRHEYRLFVTL